MARSTCIEEAGPKYRRQRETRRSDRAYTIIDGKRIKLGVYGSQESYDRFDEIRKAIKSEPEPEPEPEPPSKPTLAELMVQYLDFAKGFYGSEKHNELVHFKGAFRLLRSECADMLGEDFGPKAFKRVRQLMVDKNWSRGYINEQSGRIKRFTAWCVEEELIPPSVHHGLSAVKNLLMGRGGREPEPIVAVPDATIDATLPYMSTTVADMVQLMRLTGMRPNELCQLSAKHIDRSGEAWIFDPPKHKTLHKGKTRRIAIGPRAQTILSKYLFRTGRCFGYTTASFRRAIHRACDRAFPHPDVGKKFSRLTAKQKAEREAWRSLHRWSPNRLRHNAATDARQIAGLDGAQALLGHSSAAVTQIYAELDLRKATSVALRIG